MTKRQINNGTQHTAILFVYICIVLGDPINKKEVGISLNIAIGDPINKKEVTIPLTGCHWISN